MFGKTDHVASSDEAPASQADESQEGHSGGFRDKLHGLGDKLKGTQLHDFKIKAIHLKEKIGKFENLFNSNHRHDEPHEIATDNKRSKIADGHRFKSFAPERDGNRIKWYIDGRDYFHAVSVALERAKETIYIEDWWLSPELFLRRPPYFNQEWRIDKVLKRAAERGVKIYVVLYREVEAALTCNSLHSKHVLQKLCPKGSKGYGNIRVMRHPDHNVFENASDMTFYWAHHEKFIVIDYDLAFIGGLDLCFGRWDVRHHPLACAHPGGPEHDVWPGQDFNNNRIADFKGVEDWKNNEVSKTDFGRMPWHDVAMGVIGPCVYDIAEHFILRWNFVKRDKYKRDEDFDWITLTGRSGEDEDLIGVQRPKHPVGDYINHPLSPLDGKLGNPRQKVQHRSGGDGDDNDSEHSEEFHDAVEEVDEHGYRKDQHRFGHGIQKDLDNHNIHRPHIHKDGKKHDPNDTSQNPKHTGNNPGKEGTYTASGGLEEKRKGYDSEVVATHEGGQILSAQGTVHAQLVRSSADWSSGILTEQSIQDAYCQVIREASHFVYIENQFFITATGTNQAPVHNQIGAAIVDACIAAGKEGRKFRVIIVIPCIPGFAGDLRDEAANGTRVIMDYQYKSICRGPESIFGKIKAAGVDPAQYIFLFNLRSYDRINRTPALKKQEEQGGANYQAAQRAVAEEVMGSDLHRTGSDRTAGELLERRHHEQRKAEEKGREFKDQEEASGVQSRGAPSDAIGRDPATGSRDTISQDAMLGEPKVSEEPWAGRGEDNNEALREEEVENFIQEELYIHGKLLIVDDKVVICGSSNINDRSQLGYHDSELSIVMEDTLPLQSKMNGVAYVAGHHAATLRRMLWREHLGLLPAQTIDASDDINAQPPGDGDNDWCKGDEYDELVADPLGEEVWEMWTSRATTNTKIFRHLFHADPDDNIKTFADYDNFLGKKGSRKTGHLYDPYMPADMVRHELDKIKGHLVWMPLEFLCDAEMAETGLTMNTWTESVYT